MKKNLFLLSAFVLSGAMISCASSENIDNGDTKGVVNMLSEAKPILLTQEQQLFAKDNNGFTLNFLKKVNNTDKSGKMNFELTAFQIWFNWRQEMPIPRGVAR